MSAAFNKINDDLLIKYLLGEASEAERISVDNWLTANETNQLYYQQLQTIWEQSKTLAQTKPVDENLAWERFQSRIQKGAPLISVKKENQYAWIRIAALFILFAGAAWLIYSKINSEKSTEQLAIRAVTVPLKDTLPDGSVITLNKSSELSYPSAFKGKTRSMSLKGEAFFNVVPDKTKPFIVLVNDITILVVGTSFNVRSDNGITEVIVETGIVQVTRGNKTIELRPQEKVVVEPKDTILAKAVEEEKLYNYYRSKEFVCDNTPLWKLVEVLNEAYDAKIIIDKPTLRNIPLNTTFTNESLEQIINIISLTLNISVTRNGDTIHLR